MKCTRRVIELILHIKQNEKKKIEMVYILSIEHQITLEKERWIAKMGLIISNISWV